MYRVAFFGSDLFSLASFKKILNVPKIQNVELITRKLKVSGRGMKNIVQPEIVKFALENSIKWHEIENDFSDLNHKDFNLAIAVSYGSLIPAQFLNQLSHGGLNVHPSILPRYRGASPLQYALMNNDKYTGVSVQTLHPSKFDFGEVLWRSPPYLLTENTQLQDLSLNLAEIGAKGLVDVIENDLQVIGDVNVNVEASRAPLIKPQLSKIDFSLSVIELHGRGRALEKLYFMQKVEQVRKGKKLRGLPQVRVNLSNFDIIDKFVSETDNEIRMALNANGEELIALKVSDGYIAAKNVTVQGYKLETAKDYFTNFEKRRLKQIIK